MAKIQINPTEIELIELVKTKLVNENIQYIRKYSHKLKNFTDRRNHKFWAIRGSKTEKLVKVVEDLNKEIEVITKDYKAVLFVQKDWIPTYIRIKCLLKK